MATWYRPLLFASVNPEAAEARGVPVGRLSLMFLIVLALIVTGAAQMAGTLLVLSLAITPAAAAQRLSASPLVLAARPTGPRLRDRRQHHHASQHARPAGRAYPHHAPSRRPPRRRRTARRRGFFDTQATAACTEAAGACQDESCRPGRGPGSQG